MCFEKGKSRHDTIFVVGWQTGCDETDNGQLNLSVVLSAFRAKLLTDFVLEES